MVHAKSVVTGFLLGLMGTLVATQLLWTIVIIPGISVGYSVDNVMSALGLFSIVISVSALLYSIWCQQETTYAVRDNMLFTAMVNKVYNARMTGNKRSEYEAREEIKRLLNKYSMDGSRAHDAPPN